MKLVNPSFEIWEQGTTIEDMWKHIARCTRVCYQSEKKNDNETEEEFVKRVILRHKPDNSEANHLSVLEHGTIYLKIPYVDNSTLSHYYNYDIINKRKYEQKYSRSITVRGTYNYVTTNFRVLIENNWLDDLQYICEPTEFHERRVTVSFITNIGVSREFNRHRVNSMAEESTRYCNYNTSKFDKTLTFIESNWDWNNKAYEIYCKALEQAQQAYNKLISLGCKPQQAREVLPLATKTQLVHTAFVSDWEHFFKLRAIGVSGQPHPNAKAIAEPLMEEFIKRGYIKNIK